MLQVPNAPVKNDTATSSSVNIEAEPILSIRRIRKLRRTAKTPGDHLPLKDGFILASFLNLASSYENMNDSLL